MTTAPVRPIFDLCGNEEGAAVVEGTLEHDIAYEPHASLEGEEDEAQRATCVRDPGAPTSKEIAEHELTHLPHRSWCAACVVGRSRDRAHKRLTHREPSSVPCVVFDYAFIGGFSDTETIAVQVARDVDTKMLFAHVVPKKGLAVDHGVNQLVKDIDRLGHKKLCLKSDGEPALVSIQNEVQQL